MLFCLKSLCVFLVVTYQAYAQATSTCCDDGFNMASSYFKINKEILKGIAKIESDFNPYAALIKTKDSRKTIAFLQENKIAFKHSDPYISVSPKTKNEAITLYDSLITKNKDADILDYDLGVMQVNRMNFKYYKVDERDYFLNYHKNIFLGTDVLRKCFDRFQTAKDTIECYNRGTDDSRFRKNNYSYFSKFFNQYLAERQ